MYLCLLMNYYDNAKNANHMEPIQNGIVVEKINICKSNTYVKTLGY